MNSQAITRVALKHSQSVLIVSLKYIYKCCYLNIPSNRPQLWVIVYILSRSICLSLIVTIKPNYMSHVTYLMNLVYVEETLHSLPLIGGREGGKVY